MNKKLLIITQNYPPAICGIGDHTRVLKKCLEERGWTVIVYTSSQVLNSKDVLGGMPFGSAMLPSVLKVLQRYSNITHMLWQYSPYAYNNKGMPLFLPQVIRQVNRLFPELRQFVFFHEVQLRASGYGPVQWIRSRIQQYIAHQVQSVIKGAATSIPFYLRYFKPPKPVVIPVGSNLERVEVLENSAAVKGDYIFCFLNRADEALFQAYAQVGINRRATLVLAGKASAAALTQVHRWVSQYRLEQQVLLKGAQTQQELYALISGALFVVQPETVTKGCHGGISAKNGTIMASFEAGKAVITCFGDMTNPLHFRDQYNCWAVPFGDAAAYARAMDTLLNDDDLREQLAQNARDTYQTHFSWEIITDQFENWLTGVVS